jgi:Uma2 family endonuclease
MTVEEFEKLELPEDHEYELFEGEVLQMTWPDARPHRELQHRLLRLIESAAGDVGTVMMEFTYRIPDRKTRRSPDVGFVTKERWAATRRVLEGAPDLIIEILSPWNPMLRMNKLAFQSLANGCREFWIVDPESNVVQVRNGDGLHEYGIGDTIPRNSLGIGPIRVRDIFDGIVEPAQF